MALSGELQRLIESPYNLTEQSRTPLQQTARQLSANQVDELVRDYLAGVGSIYVLAAKYKVHRNTIASRLKERGVIVGTQPMDTDEIQRARALQADGLSWNAIGAAIKRDPKTVKNALAGNMPERSDD